MSNGRQVSACSRLSSTLNEVTLVQATPSQYKHDESVRQSAPSRQWRQTTEKETDIIQTVPTPSDNNIWAASLRILTTSSYFPSPFPSLFSL